MKFLVDNQLPAALARWLSAKGWESVHVLDLRLNESADEQIWAWAASEGFRAVQKGGKWGWMHEDGKPFVGLNYDEVGSFKDGMAPLKKGGKWSFTTKEGKCISAYKFTSITAFGATCPGLAKVNDGKKVYFIDKTGKEVAACK